MSDIAKCKGKSCPIKKKCYRYVAEADEYRQSYFTTSPYDKEKKECQSFWEVVKCKGCGKINGVHKMDCNEIRFRIHLY